MSAPLRRVGAIGDVHAEDRALEAALDFLAGQALDRIVCVGDVVDGLGDSARCCELLAHAQVEVVLGNHDRWALAGQMRSLPDAKPEISPGERAFLEALPTTRSYDTSAGRVMLCHGIGDDDMNRVGPDDYGYALEANFGLQDLLTAGTHRFVVGGHTHRRMVRSFAQTTLVNVGTLYREHQPCVAVLDFEAGQVTFHELDGRRLAGRSTTHRL